MRLVFDVGGTHIRLAVSSDGRTLDRVVRMDTDTSATGPAAFVRAAGELSRGQLLEAVAGGLPGHVDDSGRLVYAPNLPGWHNVAIVDQLQQALGRAVMIENDAALAGLGEVTRGAGVGRHVAVYMTVSTGVNGVRLVNGRIDASLYGFEVGQQLLADKTGQPQSLETLVGGAALARRTGQAPAQLRGSQVWRDEAHYLAWGLFNTLVHWSPEVVIYGGPMMRDIQVAAIAEELNKLPSLGHPWPPIVKAALGDEAALQGALALLNTKITP